jgi:hypothetical protein
MKLKHKIKPEYLDILNKETKFTNLCDEISNALETYDYLIEVPYGTILTMEMLLGNVSSPYNYFNEV